MGDGTRKEQAGAWFTGRSQLGLLGVTLPDVEAVVGWTCCAIVTALVWPGSSFLWQAEAGRRAAESGATLQGYAAQAITGSTSG